MSMPSALSLIRENISTDLRCDTICGHVRLLGMFETVHLQKYLHMIT